MRKPRPRGGAFLVITMPSCAIPGDHIGRRAILRFLDRLLYALLLGPCRIFGMRDIACTEGTALQPAEIVSEPSVPP